ncbi:protein AHNAK2 [Callospermophilus lateralis]|uniref:protein AHNAK2 n=1 Tax=Callospermophilus lateralis TaxID=76772 RepID=UPI0040545EDF
MCDCFHVVLPTWPGAPGSVSGRQLQPEEPGAATEEDRTVTEGPVDEVIRPRPQGSSPVYECTAEGTGFGVQEDAPGRQGSSGRRRSWWKRASGDSQVFSRMSHPEVVTEVTLETEVEAGASGYSVTGGGHQGIFVKQVLKDSSAAKLFSLREGDQLLSATIFFDDIKYEDALKILQYSEPYKIQFRIKRKLPAPDGEELAASGPWQESRGKEQDKDVADECTETPMKTLEADGDRERLICKPRESRGRRAHERLSWPKFQALKSKRGPGPRRSHSSSEAHEPGDARDVSPTSTDTEAQLQEELRAQKAGPGRQRRRKFLNFRFKMGSGQEPSAAGQLDREAHGRPHPAGVLGEMGPWEHGPGATGAPAGGRPEERAQWQEAGPPMQQEMEPGLPAHVLGDRAPAEGVGMAARGQRETQPVSTQHKAGEHSKPRSGTGAGRGMSWEQEWEEIQSLETGIARLSLLDTQDAGSSQTHGPETQVQVREIKTPKFGISKEKISETGKGGKGLEKKKGKQTSPGEDEGGRTEATAEEDTPVGTGPQADAARRKEQKEKTPKTPQDKGETQKDEDPESREAKAKMPRAPRSSTGRSPSREGRASPPRAGGEGKRETAREDRRATRGPHAVGLEDALPGEEQEQRQVGATQKRDATTTEENIRKGHRDQDAGEGQLRRPTFKMPSFSGSAIGRAWDASVEVRAPEAEADVALPSTQGDLKSSDLSIQLPATNLDTRDGQVDVTLPEATLPEGELLAEPDFGASPKGHLPKMQMPSIKMTKVDLKGPQVTIKGPKLDVKGRKGEVSAPSLDLELSAGQMDIQVSSAKMEGDLALADKEMATRDSKFKRPKFKMPSFGISALSKTLDTSVEVNLPKVEADVTLPSIQSDLKDPDLRMQLPEANVDIRAVQMDMTLPEATLPKKELLAAPDAEAGIKGHKPKVQMPSIKMSKVDIKGPEVDVKGPKLNVKGKKCEVNAPDLDMELPSVQVDTKVPGEKLEGDLALADKEVATKDSKFKMPKFKMPSFGLSAPIKTLDTSMEVKVPKVEVDVALPSIQGDLKTSDISIQLPTADLETRARQVEVTHPEATVPEGEFQVAPAAGASLKGHTPKMQMSSIKMAKVDLKGPQVDIKGPKLEVKGPKVEVSAPDLDMERPSGEVDMQAPSAKLEGDLTLEDKEVDIKGSKFKMPKFKMPSFSVSTPSKTLDTSMEVKAAKVEADVALPSIQSDLKTSELSIQMPTADLEAGTGQVDLTLPKATLLKGELPAAPPAGASLKGHLPKVQMPGTKMPKVDLKGPQVDVKGPKLDVKDNKGEVNTTDLNVEQPSVQVDIQAPGAKVEGALALTVKDLATKEGKFKMPKFKMPSFGLSAPIKTLDTSMEVKAPKVEADVALPSIQSDLKTSELSIQMPTADLEARTGQVDLTLPKATLPEGELPAAPPAGASLKGHLPKVQIPSIKMPKVDLKGPQVDVKGPKLDVKDNKGEVNAADLDVEQPSVQVDIQAPGAKVEGALAFTDKDLATKEGKFKMPKFKMPSFSLSAPSKTLDTTVEVKVPKVEADVVLPSIQSDLKTSDISIQLPTANLEAGDSQGDVTLPKTTLPEGEQPPAPPAGASLKGHLPKVQMSSIKMPKVDLKGPQVDIKGPKLDIKGPKVEVSGPDFDMELPSGQVDIEAPGAKLEGDLALADKEVATRDSKFKRPKFKMPSFGISAPGKTLDTSMEVKGPKEEAHVALPSIQGDLKPSDLSIQLPATGLEAGTGKVDVTLPEATLSEGEISASPSAGAKLKGHLPKMQMPSIKMPKVDLKGPQVDIKGPKLEVKGTKGEVSTPVMDVEQPSVQVDIQAPGATVEGDLALADKDVATKEGKFKVPKFKMPSLGVSAPGKALDTSVEVKVAKVEADVTLPSIHGDLKSSDLSIQPPTAALNTRDGQEDVTLYEATLPEGELLAAPDSGPSLKGHLPKVQMPSIKMPKVDLKGPKLDVKGPKSGVSGLDLEMQLPLGQVDIQAPTTKMEEDLTPEDKEVATKDSKFKRPKFKMPSFGISVPSKTLDASVEVKAPKEVASVVLPSIQGDLKTSDISIQLPPADMGDKAGQVDVTLPEATLPKGELPAAPADGASQKGQLPKGQMPSIKMPKLDLQGPHVTIMGTELVVKGHKAEMSAPDLDMEQPSGQVNIQVATTKLEGDLTLADKELATKDSKFKMPKFKMPSFGMSAPGKTLNASVEVKLPKEEANVALPSIQSDLKTSELSIQMPTADLEAGTGQVDVTLPEATLPKGELPAAPPAGASLKGHLPKVQMPSTKMPKVDLKGPQVDIKGPKLEVKDPKVKVSAPDLDMELPSGHMDIQAPSAKLEGDLALEDKEEAIKDSKFKMPKFRMPSFGVSAPGKTLDTSMEVKVPKVEADVALPSIQGDLKTSDISIQLPTANLEAGDSHGDVTLPKTTLPEGEQPPAPPAGASLKGHLPKVQMPSIKMPKVDLKGPQVDIKGPKLDVKGSRGEVSGPDLDMELPSGQVDIQAPSAKLEGDLALEDKEVDIKDSKFKMPKFKMPSFGMSAPGKTLDMTVEVKAPKVEVDVALPSIQSDLKTSDISIQLPNADLDTRAHQVEVTLPEATVPEGELQAVPAAGASLKGHLPKVQMPSIKMPKVDLKGPQVDIKGPKLEVKGPKSGVSAPDLDMKLSSGQVDIQAPSAKLEGDLALEDKEVDIKDSKFKMPKFKMPSFGMSAPGKTLDTSMEVKAPKEEANVALPSNQSDLKTSELNIQMPTADLEAGTGQVDLSLLKATLPKGELPVAPPAGASLKGHLPKVQMVSIKMPKVDLKGPQVDIKGPKLDVKGSRGEVSGPDLDMELPSGQIDIQAPSAKLEEDLALEDKEVDIKDSKFKMPKFKMPSFGMSAPGKTLDTTVEVKAPKVEVDVALPSIQSDLKTTDISIQLPTADLDTRAHQVEVTLPEATVPEGELQAVPAAGASLKGHLPKVQMPSIKMPKVDLKGPQVDIKGPKLEVKGPKSGVSAPDLDMKLSSGQVDIQVPSAKLEEDLALEDKEVDIKDSKFKMPKFKMPSFGMSAPGKTLDTTVEVKAPKVEVDVALSSIQSDLKTSELSIQMPTADLEAGTGQVDLTLPKATLPKGELPAAPPAGASLKGHLPKVQIPSIKMPKVDLKGPQVDIKGPKLDVKCSRGEVSGPDLDMELPSGQVDIQAPSAKLEGDLALEDKEVDIKDSKFKMPKFKMPSFGMSAPGKTLDMTVEVKVPKVEVDVALPSIQSDLKTSDINNHLPTADLDTRAHQVEVTLPEATVPEGELQAVPAAGASLKGHLPKVQMPSIKMPKVDLKGPQVDIKGPKLEVKGPKSGVSAPDLDMKLSSGQVDIQVPSAKLEGDLALEDKEVDIKDSKFKMPKFKMPSFSVSTPSKTLDTSMEVKAPKVEADVALPSIQSDLKTSELSIQMPTADLEAGTGQVDLTLPKATLPKGELPVAPPAGASLKGHLPKVQIPSIKMPKVDLKGPQVDIKGSKVDESTPNFDMELPSIQVDIETPSAKLEGDLALADKDVATRDSKFKRPKFKMPSFGISAPGKTLDTSMEVKGPKEEAHVALPSIQGDLKPSDLSIQLPATGLEAGTGKVDVTLPEATLSEGEISASPSAGAKLKGHLPKMQMPSIKMPKVDLKGPQLDIRGPKLEVKGTKGEVSTPVMDVEQPSVQVDIQAPGATVEGDLALADKDVATKEGKFKVPKFKMPSLGVSAPGKALDTSVEVKVAKVEADVTLPSIHGDLKSSDLSIQPPTAALNTRDGQEDVTLYEATLPEGELLAAPDSGPSLKGHLPKVQMPSIKMPKVDLKGPQIDIKGPKLDVKGSRGEVSGPDLDMELPSGQVDIQAPSAKLEGDLALVDKEVATKDSKFKRPKFKMPSFGISAPGKTLDASMEVKGLKEEADLVLPSNQSDLKSSDLSIQLATARTEQIDVNLLKEGLPKGELPLALPAGASLKGHLPKVQMPSIKMPKVDLKGPQVDIKGPKVDMKGPKVEVSVPDLDVELPSGQVDIQAPNTKLEGDLALEEKDEATKDSKFKRPKFKMPSFSISVPGKTLDTTVEVKAPKVEVDVPSIQGDLEASDLSIQLPATHPDTRAGQGDMTFPDATRPNGELPATPAAGASLKGHLPKVQMPSIKMPKVDLKGPQVDLKGSKLEVKGSKGEVSVPDLEMELPSMQVDIQTPSANLEGDLALLERDMTTKEGKFKMPKFKMPSVGLSAPGKALDTLVEVKVPKMKADVDMPSIEGDLKGSDLCIQLPDTDLDSRALQVDVTLPEATLPEEELLVASAAVSSLKGHLPKVQMPSIKMPKVDLKEPQVDVKGPKLDIKGSKGKVSTPDLELPSVQVDIQAPGAQLEGDLALADKEVATKEGKFKMPKFKMPFFGVSAPGKALDMSVEVKRPKVEADVALPSIQGDLKGSDLSSQLSATDLEAGAGQVDVTLPKPTLLEGELQAAPDSGIGLKGHLPKMQMTSIKIPKVDLKGPLVDVKGPKGEESTPNLDMELPSMEVDIQAPSAKLEGDQALADKEVTTKDSKFKMPKFKMPSFSLSAQGKTLDASVEVKVPKVEANVTLPSIQGDIKRSELSIQLPTDHLQAGPGEVDVTLSEAALPEGELPVAMVSGVDLKGHVPSIKMPKVDVKGPQVDTKGPKLEVKSPKGEVIPSELDVEQPSVQVDTQAPGTKLEGDLAVAEDLAPEDIKLESGDVNASFSKRESELTFHRPHFKFSKLFSPHKKSPRGTAGGEEASGACLLRVCPTSSSQVPGVESEEHKVSGVTSSVESPSFLTPDLPFARADGAAGRAGPPVVPGSEPPSLSQPLEACFPPGSSTECPQASGSPPWGAPSAGSESSVVCVSSPEHQSGPEDPEPPAFHARVTFPKFHKPKFGFSSAAAAVAEADSRAAEDSPGLSLLCPVEGVDSLGEGAAQPLSSGVPASPGREEHWGLAVVGGPAEAADRDGKGSPCKVPRLKLPSFSWSPKKQAVVTGDPGGHPEDATLSLVLETDEMQTQHTAQVPPMGAQMHLPSEKEGEKGRPRKPALAMPRLPLPRRKASKAPESLPPGDTDAAWSSTTDGPDSEATERASCDGGQGDTGVTAGPLEGDGGHVQLLQAHPPSLGFDKPKVEVSLSKADLRLPKHDPAIRGDSKESRLGDLSMSQSRGERMAQPEDVPTVESPEGGTATRAAPADSQAHWFRMPALRVPGFRRSSAKEPGEPWEQDTAEICRLAAPTPAEAAPDPGSMAEASVSPRPLEAQMEGAAPESESYADVPRRHLESPSLKLHFPTAPVSESGLSSPGGRTRPAIDPLPLQIPGVRPSEPLAPPGEACGEPLSQPGGRDLAKAEVRAEMWSSEPKGPLKLKASSTDVPSQVSVVNVNQLWEDSVLTVTFPKLKVPRFSFPVPSSEADVFFPVVRAVPCTEAGTEVALLQDSPGLWGASLLRASGTVVPGEQPEGPDLSSEVSPVSKVRVHIQESQGESQGVTICSNVQGECSDMAAPEASSTQIVRESEIPTSTVQMPSYGFSLLKVKIPELPAQASTYTIAQDSAAGEHSGGSPGGDTVPGDPQPDTGEPFEMISGSAHPLGPPTFPSEACSGLQLADSGSDEEPAEILEFPPDDRPEATTPLAGEDRAPKEKPEGKKSSGLLWSWLPNIGFSSTSETSADARDDAQRSAPIQTQPGAQPDPEPEKKQDRAGWFRLPRLGFSSSPAKKGKSSEEEAGLPGQKLQEETVTFFDARESFSPEEEDDEVAAGAAGARLGSRVMVASSARTELILLEDSKSAGEGPVPRPTTE